MELQHFVHWVRELRQRHVRRVFRMLAGYGIVAAALVEVTEPVVHALHLPEWTLTFVVVALALGFPVVAVFAWASSSPVEATDGGDASAGAAPHPDAPPSGPRQRLSARLAAALVAVGLLVATPGLTWLVWIRGRGGSAEARSSIAVLPFADLSAGKDQAYFADGIAEEILNALVHVDGLQVSGQMSSFYFKDKPTSLADIARQLNVANVLQGSVRKDGNRVRVTAQLVDVARGVDLWSDSYDRELTDIFAVQDDVARAVVNALKVKILPGSGSDVKEHRTANLDAYNAYLLGRHFFDLGTPEGMRRSVTELEKAVALDPNYAPGWAWLSVSVLNADVYLAEGRSAAAIDEAARRAIEAADRAVALGPDLAECWSARGWMRTSIAWDWDGAQADFRRALALNPRDTNILVRYSHLLAVLGRLPEAIATARKVVEIDPLYSWGWDFLSGYELGSGRPDLARDAATRALEIAPDHIYSRMTLGIADLLLDQPQEALAQFQRDRSEVIRLAGTALARHALGDSAEEEKTIAALRERIRWIKSDPLLARIRDDPRYVDLLRKMGLPTS